MSDAVSRLRQEIAVHDSISDDMCDQFRNDIEAVCDEIEQLTNALSDCADRLESCAIAGGSDPEYAALAVKEYRDLLPTKD